MKILSKTPWRSAIRFGIADLVFMLGWFIIFVLGFGWFTRTDSAFFIILFYIFMFPASIWFFIPVGAIQFSQFASASSVLITNIVFWAVFGYITHKISNLKMRGRTTHERGTV